MTGVQVDGPRLTVGSVVWVQPRAPEMRYTGYRAAGCWPAVVRRIEGGWVFVEPCAGPSPHNDGLVMLSLDRDNVATSPCASCQDAWTAAGWAQLGRAS